MVRHLTSNQSQRRLVGGANSRVAGRLGVSLIELLVVIAIIAVLTALLLPAVQSARESARKSQCQGKLKQIGTALAHYESGADRFPPGIAAPVWGSQGPKTLSATERDSRAMRLSTMTYEWTYFLHMLLPQFDEKLLYESLRAPLFRLDSPWGPAIDVKDVETYGKISGRQIETLLCPSDSSASGVWQVTNAPAVPGLFLAKTNYLGMFSGLNVFESMVREENPSTPAIDSWDSAAIGNLPLELLYPLPPRAISDRRAVFGFGVGTSLSSVKDGTGKTVAVVEYLRGLTADDGRGAFWMNQPGMQMLQARQGPNSSEPDMLNSTGASLTFPNLPNNNLPCVEAANTVTWNGGSASVSGRPRGLSGYAGARSGHTGGVFALFCDGHVQFIDNSVDSNPASPYGTWQRLCWIDDGKAIQGDY